MNYRAGRRRSSVATGGSSRILACEPDIVLIAEAATGPEAIDLFRAYRPDATLMDLQIPGVKGDDVIKSIRKEFPDARILVETTYDGDVRALRAMKAGACGYDINALDTC